jgi:hypothetical protein
MKYPGTKKLMDTIEECYGIQIEVAKKLDVTRLTVSNWIAKDPKLQVAVKLARESLYDVVESKLLQNIKDGKETSMIWFMKTQMRNRGYTDKAELDINSKNITVTFVQEGGTNIQLNDNDDKIIQLQEQLKQQLGLNENNE